VTAIARQGWDSILAEAVRSSGGKNYPSYNTRLQYLIYEAYLQVAFLYHHQELETSSDLALSTGDNTISYPSDCYLLMAVAELDANSLPKSYISPIDIKALAGIFLGTVTGAPQNYAAFNRVVIFDRKSDVDRNFRLYYMKVPAAPDFTASTVPDLGQQWDSAILDLALMRAGMRDGDVEMAKLFAGAFSDFADQQLTSPIRSSTAPNFDQTDTTDRPAGAKLT